MTFVLMHSYVTWPTQSQEIDQGTFAIRNRPIGAAMNVMHNKIVARPTMLASEVVGLKASPAQPIKSLSSTPLAIRGLYFGGIVRVGRPTAREDGFAMLSEILALACLKSFMTTGRTPPTLERRRSATACPTARRRAGEDAAAAPPTGPARRLVSSETLPANLTRVTKRRHCVPLYVSGPTNIAACRSPAT